MATGQQLVTYQIAVGAQIATAVMTVNIVPFGTAGGTGPEIVTDASYYLPGTVVTATVSNGPAGALDIVALYNDVDDAATAIPLNWKYLASDNQAPPATGLANGSVTLSLGSLPLGAYKVALTTAEVVVVPPTGLGLYETFEKVVTNSGTYANKFDMAAIQLNATFVAPAGGGSFAVLGFHDGGTTWKIRFPPHVVGTWTYTWTWSDATAGGSGTFDCGAKANALLHGPVQNDGTRFLKYLDGTPHFLLISQWIWGTIIGPPSKNGQLNDGSFPPTPTLTGAYASDAFFDAELNQLAAHNIRGATLSLAMAPLEADGVAWDLTWCGRIDRFVQQCLARGIYCTVSILNFDATDVAGGFWFRRAIASGTTQAFNCWAGTAPQRAKTSNALKYMAARWGGYSNIYYELGNEMDNQRDSSMQAIFDADSENIYLPLLDSIDPFDRPVMCSSRPFSDGISGLDILCPHTIDDNQPSSSMPAVSGNKRWMVNEFVVDETAVNYTLDTTVRNTANRFGFRRANWRVFCQGGCGSIACSWRVIGDYPTAVLDTMNDQKYFADFLGTLGNFNLLLPLEPSIVTAGAGASSGTGRRRTRGIVGQKYVTYIEATSGAAAFTCNLPAGSYTVSFYDPSTGVSTPGSTSPVTGTGSANTSVPHPAFSNDIVLVLTIAGGVLAAPVNTALPVITGTPTVGQTLTASTGTWTGNPTPTYAYQWLRAGANIASATASTYLLVTADIGQVSVRVTATNSQGSSSATSAAVTVAAGGGGGGGLEAVNPAAAQFTLTAASGGQHTWRGFGWSMGGPNFDAVNGPGLVAQWPALLFEDINAKWLNGYGASNNYKAFADLGAAHGVTNFYMAGYIYQAGQTPAQLADLLKADVDFGIPWNWVCLQNEPDSPAGGDHASSLIVPDTTALRNRLNAIGLSTVKITTDSFAHFGARVDEAYTLLTAAGAIPSVVRAGSGHAYGDCTTVNNFNNWKTALGAEGMCLFQTEAGNGNVPSSGARMLSCLNNGVSVYMHFIGQASNNSAESLLQSMVRVDGTPSPCHGQYKALSPPLTLGSVFRTVTCSDRPPGINASLADRMVLGYADRAPRVTCAVAKRPDNKWVLEIVNLTFGTDTFQNPGGHYGAATLQPTVTIAELVGTNTTFSGNRVNNAGVIVPGQSYAMVNGVLRCTLAWGETLALVSA